MTHLHDLSSALRRKGLLALALCLAVVSVDAQGQQGRGRVTGAAPPPASTPAGLVRQVKAALAHGDVAGARRLAETGDGDAAAKAVAAAVVDMFEGKDEAARTRLQPIADRAVLSEAALELGLLELRTGKRDAGQRRLAPLVAVRTFSSVDDYFRLARAARGAREFLLANDAYQRIAEEQRADVQTEWGDLFYQRHLPGDALTNYQKALEIDPRWLPAMLGLARALADEEPDDARKALDTARTQAPDYPDLLLLTAEERLGAEEVAEAKSALDRLARVKPGTVEEAAIRSAIAYKEQGMGSVDAAAARVKEIDPTSGLGYRTAAAQAAHDYRFDEAAELARKATQIDPEDAQAWFDLGLSLMRTGDEPAARTALETSWDLDKSAPLTKNMLDNLDVIDTFEIVSHNEFTFKFAKNEAAIMKIYALPLADEAYRQYVSRYGFRPQGPILVEVFSRHDDFAVRTLGLPGLVGALGACFGRVVSMDSPKARPPGDFSWQATLWHELAHVFTLQLSDRRVPRWLTEGISVYEEHRREPAWGRELTLEFARQLGKGQTFGVKKLPEAFKHPESLSLAYFESSLVVEHLVALNGEAGLRTLLLAYKDGAKDAEAFTKAFGRSIDDVDRSFAAFVEQRYGALRDAMKDPPSQVAADDLPGLRARAAAAPGNFVSQFSFGQALVRDEQFAAAKAPLERAAQLAPQALGSGSPRGLLARIAELENDPERARRELRALLTVDHTNVVAARRLATLATAARAADDENLAWRLIADLDPFDAEVHGKLGGRLLARGENAAALLEFQAALALNPANPAEAHSDAAEALLKLRRFDEAKKEALAALKAAPTFARAQDLLLAASAAGN